MGIQVLDLLGYTTLTDIDIDQNPNILKEFDNGLQIRLGKYGKPPYFLAVRGTEIGNRFKEKRK